MPLKCSVCFIFISVGEIFIALETCIWDCSYQFQSGVFIPLFLFHHEEFGYFLSVIFTEYIFDALWYIWTQRQYLFWVKLTMCCRIITQSCISPGPSPLIPVHFHPLFSLNILTCRHFNIHASFLPCLIGEMITKLFQWCFFRFVALDRWWPCRDMFWWQATNPTTSNSGCKSLAAESSWGSLEWWPVGITAAGSRGSSTPYSPNTCCPQAAVPARSICSHFTFSAFLSYSFVIYSSNHYFSGIYVPGICTGHHTYVSTKAIFWSVYYLKNLTVLRSIFE